MSRPSDYVDSTTDSAGEDGFERAESLKLGAVGWLRWGWRQLTTMRTALVLLLLLAVASVPGSLVPQRSADPNGVVAYYENSPDYAAVLDFFQLFDVYSSVWFSAIYILLFISLIGCVLPRTKHHWQALRAQPPKTPARLGRLPGHTVQIIPEARAERSILLAAQLLKKERYRVLVVEGATPSVSAERGYLRETGNLIFHTALIGVLAAVGLGGGFGYTGQSIVVEDESFVNTLSGFDSFNPGRFFTDQALPPFTLKLDDFESAYSLEPGTRGAPMDYTAHVTATVYGAEADEAQIKVNQPLHIEGTQVYLLGNGYAPVITVRDAEGGIAFQGAVPFLPQDTNLTSTGVIKVPDGLDEQLGLIGFFYPTVARITETGALTSTFPGMLLPMMTLQVYVGDLGLDQGIPKNVYVLDTEEMEIVAGGEAEADALQLEIGDTVELPNGLGSITLDDVKRFVSFDIHRDPAQGWVLVFAILALTGLLTSLFIPRRRVWVSGRDTAEGVRLEYAGLARGEDPGLAEAVRKLAERHAQAVEDELDREAGEAPTAAADGEDDDAEPRAGT